MNDALLGPAAALALSLLFNGLFYAGKILPRNTVPREDYEALKSVNASISDALAGLTATTAELVVVVRHLQRNEGL